MTKLIAVPPCPGGAHEYRMFGILRGCCAICGAFKDGLDEHVPTGCAERCKEGAHEFWEMDRLAQSDGSVKVLNWCRCCGGTRTDRRQEAPYKPTEPRAYRLVEEGYFDIFRFPRIMAGRGSIQAVA